MTAMRLLILAVIVACALAEALSVPEQEIQDLPDVAPECSKIIQQLQDENERQNQQIQELFRMVNKLVENDEQRKKDYIHASVARIDDPLSDEFAQNSTIEERVALLEIQVVEIEEDVSGLVENVNFLFDETVIQDERLFSLEERMLNVETDNVQINEDIAGLQDTTLALDFRVTVLEENGGGDGNSSISELEERVETLEGTAADHETRITSTEGNVGDLEEVTDGHETRITAAEENIQGLQMTDINHDTRITALEENSGSGSENETIAFHAILTSYTSIPVGSTLVFNEMFLNEGDGYDDTTGIFTVPSGGDGLYYFSLFLSVDYAEYGRFEIRVNDVEVCQAFGDHGTSGIADQAHASCSAVVDVVEGDEVEVVCRSALDTSPLYVLTAEMMNGFNGFRI